VTSNSCLAGFFTTTAKINLWCSYEGGEWLKQLWWCEAHLSYPLDISCNVECTKLYILNPHRHGDRFYVNSMLYILNSFP
jgi:hypothetical protein